MNYLQIINQMYDLTVNNGLLLKLRIAWKQKIMYQ